jgi:glutathione-regulated potassium-efflux system protein KefB
VFESAVALSADALVKMGEKKGNVAKVISEFRRRDAERLAMQHQSGNARAGIDISFGRENSDAFDME